MSVGGLYTVTVGRINERLHEDPEFTMVAQSLTLHPDGSLSIQEGTGGRSFGAGTWDTLSVKRGDLLKVSN
jgi:hypothetical protein